MSLDTFDYGSSINSLVTNIYDFPSTGQRILLTEPVQPWHDRAVEQLEKLIRLKEGWDGYQALPVSFANATFALRMLEAVCQYDAPVPQIVPGVSGDLQIEWHTMQGDIELHVKAPNDVLAWHSALGEFVEGEEIQLTFDFIEVAGWVKEIAETPIANYAAA